jgi:glucose-1-phosphate cytidylyltransferase
MKAVILAGGYGTRISEESAVRPKPMISIGNRPILWHIMKIYAAHGINEFVICCGHKGDQIKDYFSKYLLHSGDVTFDFGKGETISRNHRAEPWRVTCVDTGESTMTGGRLRRAAEAIGDGTFCLTYGDGVSDTDIAATIRWHRSHGRLASLTAVQCPGRFGAFTLADGDTRVSSFREKPPGDGAWINGGFFVLEPEVIDYIDGDSTVWEREPMDNLAKDDQLRAWRHDGFWQPMDTLRDRMVLEQLHQSGKAPWMIWENRYKGAATAPNA